MSSEIPIRHALIMAAGRGSRMRPLTDVIPKPMIPFKNDTLIGNSLTMLRQCVSFVHVTVGYKKALLSEYLMTRGVDSLLNTEGHGNAWWIHNTLMQFLNEPVLVLTTDNITQLDIEFLTREYYRLGATANMLVPVFPIPNIDGDYIEHEGGFVFRIQRREPQPIYCSGLQVLNPVKVISLIPDVDDFLSIWRALINVRQLTVSTVYPKPWYSVDTLEQLSNLERS